MQQLLLRRSTPLWTALIAGCSLATSEPGETRESTAAIQGKAGTYTVTMSDWADVSAATPPQLILNGSSSRNLSFASAWVPDDSIGLTTWNLRQFSITLRDGYEINSVIAGLPLFVELDTATGTPNDFQTRLIVHPGFYNRSGTTAMALTQTCTPIRVRDPIDPLRYRASVVINQVMTGADFILPDNTRIAGVAGPNNQFFFDLTFNQVYSAMGQTVIIEGFGLSRNYLKYAEMRAKVQEVAVTTEDPGVVWPEPNCDPAVHACLEQYPAELASCGNYYQVSGCAAFEPCLLDGSPSELFDLVDPGIDSAAAAYNAGSGNGTEFYWTEVTVTPYDVEGCDATFEWLVDGLVTSPGVDFSSGTVTDLAGYQAHIFSNSSYSSGGPQLYNAVMAFGGAGTFQAWTYSHPIPCHNCSTFEDWVIVYFPDTQRAVLLAGGHGYDS